MNSDELDALAAIAEKRGSRSRANVAPAGPNPMIATSYIVHLPYGNCRPFREIIPLSLSFVNIYLLIFRDCKTDFGTKTKVCFFLMEKSVLARGE